MFAGAKEFPFQGLSLHYSVRMTDEKLLRVALYARASTRFVESGDGLFRSDSHETVTSARADAPEGDQLLEEGQQYL